MNLQDYRREIDRIDVELVRLFAERMEISSKIAAYKRENSLPVQDAQREREKLDEIRAMLPNEWKEYGAALYERIFSLSRSWQMRSANIIFIGMPGCGKTTIARALGEALGREVFDCDELVEQKAGMTIPELFAQRGEKAFRKLETETLTELCLGAGHVIATGGGCVTREENERLLRGGVVIWLQRSLDLLPKEGRPISLRRDLRELYTERAPLYEALADFVIDNNGTIDDTVKSVISVLKRKEDA